MSAGRPSVLRPDHAGLVVHGRDRPGLVVVVPGVLARRGADVRCPVPSRAVLWHCRGRTVRHDRRSIVF